MEEIVIEKGIPAPKIAQYVRSPAIWQAIRKLNVGDSFMVPAQYDERTSRRFAAHATARVKGRRYSASKAVGRVRIWRVA